MKIIHIEISLEFQIVRNYMIKTILQVKIQRKRQKLRILFLILGKEKDSWIHLILLHLEINSIISMHRNETPKKIYIFIAEI